MTKNCILHVEDRAGVQTLVTKILYGLVTKIALVTVKPKMELTRNKQ